MNQRFRITRSMQESPVEQSISWRSAKITLHPSQTFRIHECLLYKVLRAPCRLREIFSCGSMLT